MQRNLQYSLHSQKEICIYLQYMNIGFNKLYKIAER
jgi:hypothetical protein